MASEVIFSTLADAEEAKLQHEREHTVRYVKWTCPKDFGNLTSITSVRPKVCFFKEGEHLLPYLCLGVRTYSCHLGKDQKIKRKERLSKARELDHMYEQTQVRKVALKGSKKVGCTAKVSLKEVLSFPDLKIAVTSSKHDKKVVGKRMRSNLEAGTKAFILYLPDIGDHSFHDLYAKIDPRVREKIYKLCGQGDLNIKAIQRRLYNFARSICLDRNNKRFYPNRSSITHHISLAGKNGMNTFVDDKDDDDNDDNDDYGQDDDDNTEIMESETSQVQETPEVKTLGDKLFALKQNFQLTDVNITCQGTVINAHKIVLSAGSTYFKSMFCDDPDYSRATTVDFSNVMTKPLQLSQIIDFMYTGAIEITQATFTDFESIGIFYGIEDLVEMCAQFVEHACDPKKCVQYYLKYLTPTDPSAPPNSVRLPVTGSLEEKMCCALLKRLQESWKEIKAALLRLPSFHVLVLLDQGVMTNCSVAEIIAFSNDWIAAHGPTAEPKMVRTILKIATEKLLTVEAERSSAGIQQQLRTLAPALNVRPDGTEGEAEVQASVAAINNLLQLAEAERSKDNEPVDDDELTLQDVGEQNNLYLQSNQTVVQEIEVSSSSAVANVTVDKIVEDTDAKHFKCDQCPYLCSRKSMLDVHMRKHGNKRTVGTLHCCEYCGRSFCKQTNLQNHLQTHFQGDGSMVVNSPNSDGTSSFCDTLKPFTCETCDQTFRTKAEMSKHVQVHKPHELPTCKLCGKMFSTESAYDRHMENHPATPTTEYYCDICQLSFKQKNSLASHMRKHAGRKKFGCEECGRQFSSSIALFQHQRDHTWVKPFTCMTCGKSFAMKNNLQKHIRIHAGEKAYKCHKCDKTFAHPNTLGHHIKTHATEEDSKGHPKSEPEFTAQPLVVTEKWH